MTSDGQLRFLLDQQFPQAPFDVHALDQAVTYQHLSAYAPELSRQSTPDWMLHLVAADGGFDGLVTIDRSQLTEDAELIALNLAGISVITWKGGEDDVVVLWGQLLAYMPQIVKAMNQTRPIVITLPNPRLLPTTHLDKPGEMARRLKLRDNVSFPERRDRAVRMMRQELDKRGAGHLAAQLLPKKQKPAAAAVPPA